MTWDLRTEELETVFKLPASQRYAYFIKHAADWEKVWGLRDADGWVTAQDDAGHTLMPIWPHPDYARACAIDAWENATPESLDLHDWVEGWLPELESRQRGVSVFPVPMGPGIAVEPDRLRGDLASELSLYE
jgi:hypothetical protein